MKNLTDNDAREIGVKNSKRDKSSQELEEYRARIADEDYLNDAIYKIASDLSHYLTK